MRSTPLFTLILCILALFFFAGCGGGGGGGGGGSPGTGSKVHLQFTQAGSMARSAARVAAASALASPSSVDFEEGDLKTTRTYLFILKNTGTVAATNVVLSSTNSAVHVSPSTIGILQPEGAGGVQPVIQVTVEHGVSATGAGYADTLAGGRMEFNISATSAEVTATASVGVNVKVASITASFLGEPTDLRDGQNGYANPIATQNGTVVPAQYIGYYTGASATKLGGMATVTNTGNVPVTIVAHAHDPYPAPALFLPTSTVTIEPGETVSVNGFAQWYGGTPGVDDGIMVVFQVNSDGVEFDSSVMPHADASGAWWSVFTAEQAPAG